MKGTLKKGVIASSVILGISLITACSQPTDEAQNNTNLVSANASSSTSMTDADASTTQNNPFFKKWSTPFETPPFSEIKTEHFLPAFENGIVEHAAQIEAIANYDGAPTFDNTLAEMEKSGKMLTRVSRVFFNLTGTESNDEMQTLQREISPKLTRHSNSILLNDALFARIKEVYNNRVLNNLNAEQLRLTERIYNDFVRAGANLNEDDKARLAQINESLSSLTTQFGQNMLNDTREFALVLEADDLAGLPQTVVNAAAAQAKSRDMEGKYVITFVDKKLKIFINFII